MFRRNVSQGIGAKLFRKTFRALSRPRETFRETFRGVAKVSRNFSRICPMSSSHFLAAPRASRRGAASWGELGLVLLGGAGGIWGVGSWELESWEL